MKPMKEGRDMFLFEIMYCEDLNIYRLSSLRSNKERTLTQEEVNDLPADLRDAFKDARLFPYQKIRA